MAHFAVEKSFADSSCKILKLENINKEIERQLK